jgi:hypothetical protein
MLFLQEDAIAKVRELQSTYFSYKEKWCNLTYKKGQAQQRAQIGHQRESIPPAVAATMLTCGKSKNPCIVSYLSQAYLGGVFKPARMGVGLEESMKELKSLLVGSDALDGLSPPMEFEAQAAFLRRFAKVCKRMGMPSEQQQLDTCGGPGKPDPTHIVDFHKKEYIVFLKGELSMLPVPRVSPSSRMHMDENVNPNNA